MLKSILYLFLLVLGLGATLSSSLWGAVTVILAFLLNPIVLAREIPLLRYQFYATIAFILSIMMNPIRPLQSTSADRLVFRSLWTYVAICYLSSIWAVKTYWSYEHAYNFSKTVLVAWLLTKVVNNERGIHILIIACLIGAFHATFMHTFGIDLGWVSQRHGGEFGVLPTAQAPVMVLFLPLFVLIAIFGRNRFENLLGWVSLPIVLNSIVESYQRAYFVGLLAEGIYLLVFLPKRITLRLAPALVAAVLLYVFVLTPENYWSWMDTINSPTEEGSANSRFDLYKGSAQMLSDHPMGVGYRCYLFESHKYLPERLEDPDGTLSAHSSICTVACETGILGFSLWITSIGAALWLLRKIRKAADLSNPSQIDIFAMGIEIGLYGWFVGGLFHSDHEVDPTYWFLAFAVVLYRLRFAPGNKYDKHRELDDDSDLDG